MGCTSSTAAVTTVSVAPSTPAREQQVDTRGPTPHHKSPRVSFQCVVTLAMKQKQVAEAVAQEPSRPRQDPEAAEPQLTQQSDQSTTPAKTAPSPCDDDSTNAGHTTSRELDGPQPVSCEPAAVDPRSLECPPPPLWDFIAIEDVEAGAGVSASVHRAVDVRTNQDYAVKVIQKRHVAQWNFLARREVQILHFLPEHPNVVRLHSAIEDQHSVFMLLDWCGGGDLLSFITRVGHLSERDAAHVLHQVADGLQHLHKNNVIHRDIKPENILLVHSNSSTGKRLQVKIADFGLSCMKCDFTKAVGTVAYCAPEVLTGAGYNNSCDVYSMGIVMYVLLGGYHPFQEYGPADTQSIAQRIVKSQWAFDDPVWHRVSEEAKGLIRGLMHPDKTKRLALKDFLHSPWMSRWCGADSDVDVNLPLPSQTQLSPTELPYSKSSPLSHDDVTHHMRARLSWNVSAISVFSLASRVHEADVALQH